MKRTWTPVLLGAIVAFSLTTLAQQQAKPISKADLEEMTERISKDVAELRGLPFEKPIQKGILTRPELKKLILEVLYKEMPKERMLAYQKTLTRFGLLPEGTDLEKTLVNFLTENVAGLYNDETQRLYLIREVNRALQGIALSHELTHRLQDEHFGLAKLPLKDKENDDLAIAALAVVEGDATEVMYRYAQIMITKDPKGFAELANSSDAMAKEMESLKAAPLYLKRNLLFPYANGLTFVNHLKALGGNDKLNAAFRSPPMSSEQILHPEKYTAKRDDPTFLRLPDLTAALGPGWKEVLVNVMGELNVQVLCEQFGLSPTAVVTAAGWDGDCYACYEQTDTGRLFLAWISTWDSEADAREFFDVYRTALQKKYPDAVLTDSDVSGVWTYRTKKHGYVTIQRKGKDVLVLDGCPSGRLPAVRALAWRAERADTPLKDSRPRTTAPPPAPTQAATAPRRKIQVDPKEVDKVYDDVGKKFGVKGRDLKAMTRQFGAANPSTGKIVGNKYIDRTKGFEIACPKGWAFTTDLPMPMACVAMMDQRSGAFFAMIPFPFNMEPLEMWMPMLEGVFGMQFEEFTKIRSGRIAVGDRQAYELLFNGVQKRVGVRFRLIVVPTPVLTYVMMCAAPTAAYEARSADLDAIVKSFKIYATPRPAEPAPAAPKKTPEPAARP